MNHKKITKLTIIFYLIVLIILISPLILQLNKLIYLELLNDLLQLLKINFNLITIFIFITSLLILILTDLLIFKDKKRLAKNIKLIEMSFGEKRNIFTNLTLSLLSGSAEELLFRGYLFILTKIIISNIIIIIIFLSLIFALLHIIQGLSGFILTFIASIVLFILLITAHSLWYAVIFHLLFNFIQLNFLIDFQKKNLQE
jgi:membrane protease YdiL (CAAX protease family)